MLGDLNKLKVVELKAELANRGLDTKGVKAVLVDRLKAALEEEGGGLTVVGDSHGSEDQKSSQESNDECESLSTPARRGRRATSTRESSPPPIASKEVVQEQPQVEPQVFEAEAQSFSLGNSSEEVQQGAQGQDFSTGTADEVQQYEESSESKDSSEQQEVSSPEQPGVEESQSSNAFNQDDSEPFPSESVGDSQSSLNYQEESQSLPAETDEDSKPQSFAPESCAPDNCVPESFVPESFATQSFAEVAEAESANNTMDIKVEPPDTQPIIEENTAPDTSNEVKEEPGPVDSSDDIKDEGSKRVRRSRFTDNDDVQAEVKEEPADSQETSGDVDGSQVKSEPVNERKRRRSGSRSPRRRSRSPHVKREDEPEIDDSAMLLSWYDSDLNLIVEKSDFLTAAPMHQQGFGFIWAGARGSFGFCRGKICFEVKCVEACDVSHLENEVNPHVLRVGWSVQGTSMQLGEEKLSYGYGGTGKASVDCQFKDYGKPFTVGDTVSAYLDLDSEPKILSYALNGEPQGVAFEISSDVLESKALFPHVLSKNMKFTVNFSGEPAFPLLDGFTLCGNVPVEDRVAGPRRPEKKEDCEIIMMCGLPGCGKTFWANKYCAENPEKLFNILGTNNLIDKMKVMGLPRKRNYSGRWDVLIEKCTKCLQKLLDLAGRRRRNYILDQTNVYPSAVRRKMGPFEGFKKRAVVIVPAHEEFVRRVEKREAEEGKDVPDHAVLEMKANFKVPEVGDIFSEVMYVELPEEEARPLVEKYREEAEEKGYKAQPTHQSKRFKSERSGSSGDRRFDDRHSSRDSRDHRDRRDHREYRDREYRDRGTGYRPRGGPGDRNRSGWQPRGGPGGGWRDRSDGYRGRGDSRGPWRSGGGRGGLGGGYDRHRGGGGGYNQSRGSYGGRGGSKGWGYNQGSGGSSWSSWSQQPQQDYSQGWQGQGQSGYSSGWKGYGQQPQSQQQQQQQHGYGQATGYTPQQGYSSYGNGSNSYNWNQQYYQSYGGWGQQTQGSAATGTVANTATSTVPATGSSSSYDPYQQWNQFSQYGYSTSTGTTAAGTTSSTHSAK